MEFKCIFHFMLVYTFQACGINSYDFCMCKG